MVFATLMFINPPDRLKFNPKASGQAKIKENQEQKIYELIKMSHFPYRKRRKNLLTADKTKATKTKSQQLQTTGFGFGSVCLVFFFGAGKRGVGALQWAMEYSSNCWWVLWWVCWVVQGGAGWWGSDYSGQGARKRAERRWRLATIASTLALMNMSTLCQSETRVFHGSRGPLHASPSPFAL